MNVITQEQHDALYHKYFKTILLKNNVSCEYNPENKTYTYLKGKKVLEHFRVKRQYTKRK